MLALHPAVPTDALPDDAPASPGARLRVALRRAETAARLEDAARGPRFVVRTGAETTATASCQVHVVCEATAPGARAAHVERALTAAQRYMLSLWADGFDARWEAPPEGALAHDTVGREVTVGRVLVSG